MIISNEFIWTKQTVDALKIVREVESVLQRRLFIHYKTTAKLMWSSWL